MAHAGGYKGPRVNKTTVYRETNTNAFFRSFETRHEEGGCWGGGQASLHRGRTQSPPRECRQQSALSRGLRSGMAPKKLNLAKQGAGG